MAARPHGSASGSGGVRVLLSIVELEAANFVEASEASMTVHGYHCLTLLYLQITSINNLFIMSYIQGRLSPKTSEQVHLSLSPTSPSLSSHPLPCLPVEVDPLSPTFRLWRAALISSLVWRATCNIDRSRGDVWMWTLITFICRVVRVRKMC